MQIEIPDEYMLAFCGAKPEANTSRNELVVAVKNYLYGDPSRIGERREIMGRLLIDALEFSLNEQLRQEKPQPYSIGCNAKGIPGAVCQSPNCDC